MTGAVENSYLVEGSVLDVYQGAPFWLDGQSSNNGSASVTSWLIDKGEIAGIVVSDTTVISITTKVPASDGMQCRTLMLVDEDAAPEVVRWVVDAFQGRLGGPLARLATLSGNQLGFYQVPISYRLGDAHSTVSVPDKVKVVTSGRPIPWHPVGSAAPWQRCWIGRGAEVTVGVPEFEMVFSLPQARAVRGCFRFAS